MGNQKPDDLPLRHDLSSIVGYAIGEYDLTPGEIAQALRDTAEWVEGGDTVHRLHHGHRATKEDNE